MNRDFYSNKIREYLEISSICAILGPRQCGKTTLAKSFAENNHYHKIHIFDLENPVHLARLANPILAKNKGSIKYCCGPSRYFSKVWTNVGYGWFPHKL